MVLRFPPLPEPGAPDDAQYLTGQDESGLTNEIVVSSSSPLAATRGGTGLNAVGANGNILTSNGTIWVSQAPPATTSLFALQTGDPVTVNGNTTITDFSQTQHLLVHPADGTNFTIDLPPITDADVGKALVFNWDASTSQGAAGATGGFRFLANGTDFILGAGATDVWLFPTTDAVPQDWLEFIATTKDSSNRYCWALRGNVTGNQKAYAYHVFEWDTGKEVGFIGQDEENPNNLVIQSLDGNLEVSTAGEMLIPSTGLDSNSAATKQYVDDAVDAVKDPIYLVGSSTGTLNNEKVVSTSNSTDIGGNLEIIQSSSDFRLAALTASNWGGGGPFDLNSGGGFNRPVHYLNSTSDSFNLPPVSEAGAVDQIYIFVNNGSSQTLTVIPDGTDLINGVNANIVLNEYGEVLAVQCRAATEWIILWHHRPTLPINLSTFLDGTGSTLVNGTEVLVRVPMDMTLQGVTLLADQSGSITLDVLSATYAGYPTFSSIVAAAPPTISSATKSQDTTLTGWTTALSAGDILKVKINGSVTNITYLAVNLHGIRR